MTKRPSGRRSPAASTIPHLTRAYFFCAPARSPRCRRRDASTGNSIKKWHKTFSSRWHFPKTRRRRYSVPAKFRTQPPPPAPHRSANFFATHPSITKLSPKRTSHEKHRKYFFANRILREIPWFSFTTKRLSKLRNVRGLFDRPRACDLRFDIDFSLPTIIEIHAPPPAPHPGANFFGTRPSVTKPSPKRTSLGKNREYFFEDRILREIPWFSITTKRLSKWRNVRGLFDRPRASHLRFDIDFSLPTVFGIHPPPPAPHPSAKFFPKRASNRRPTAASAIPHLERKYFFRPKTVKTRFRQILRRDGLTARRAKKVHRAFSSPGGPRRRCRAHGFDRADFDFRRPTPPPRADLARISRASWLTLPGPYRPQASFPPHHLRCTISPFVVGP